MFLFLLFFYCIAFLNAVNVAYKPDKGEVFFCGNSSCKRQQLLSKGERCINCGKQTVSWYTLQERDSTQMESNTWALLNHYLPTDDSLLYGVYVYVLAFLKKSKI